MARKQSKCQINNKPTNNHIAKLGGKEKGLKTNLEELKKELPIYRGTRTSLQLDKEWCEMFTV